EHLASRPLRRQGVPAPRLAVGPESLPASLAALEPLHRPLHGAHQPRRPGPDQITTGVLQLRAQLVGLGLALRGLDEEGTDRLHRGLSDLALLRAVRVGPLLRIRLDPAEVLEIADHVVAALLELGDPRRGELRDPGVLAGREAEPRSVRALGEGAVG